MNQTCVLCDKGFGEEPPVNLKEKGLRTLVQVSREEFG